MQIYLVGGAVRDQLLGLAVKDKDFVVVGASVGEMLALGYQQVGRDFPVFLHPGSKAEHALARTERKAGHGYTGFVVHAAPEVTLEEDLIRRDLTINAMAQAEDGTLVDPFGGQADLDARLLRHVSPAFSEDPLRVLRVARFGARYAHLGFVVADETQALMSQMSASGELEHLTAERVWKELEGALLSPAPQVFFQILRDCGALKVLFPELDDLFGIPAPAKWHPEIDTGVHALMVVEQAAKLSDALTVRFAALCHDFGKARTPPAKWPSHHGHGQLGLPLIRDFCQRYRVPSHCRDLALLVSDLHCTIHQAQVLRPDTVVKLFDKMDAWRKPQRVQELLLCCVADFKGRAGFEELDYVQADIMARYFDAARDVDVKAIVAQGHQGSAIGEQLRRQRVRQVAALRQAQKDQQAQAQD